MPKLVNHEEKRNQIAEATWRVIRDQGMEAATVRSVAKEAGMSIGALRHYFATQEELLLYAMNLVVDRVTERIRAIARSGLPPLEMVLRILLEIIPHSPETTIEMDVWFSFVVHFRHKRELLRLPQDGIYRCVSELLGFLEAQRLLRSGLDLALETERLYALVDGVALHALLEPERLGPDAIIHVLRLHIETLCAE
ncbi:HTH-type transcriptional regulator PksA [Paenibacillus sp. J31TS4]|uniref:TetR/AcrR family transcriptional regulator n=1 Tax=Paenibacillus sp. J31TS4 TaxID=2807195 RepID=UPI001B0D29D1|nr:TetR/AcrR family transcriptional regulator [Paenibacillus sp. J31TS4]GIP40401.1 HTH-type transcriptional regulator PksA [Paenibacillus sp. J31TS4]